jgi:hypothetical protein
MQVRFDPKPLLGRISELDKVQIPNAANIALNQALFQTRKRLREEANTVFEKKTPFTINSFLYEKPKQRGDDLEGRVFVRDDAPGGNAPSRYLDPHIRGGKAYSTRFQRALERTVVTQIDGRRTTAKQQATMMSPSASKIGVRRNKYGNMTPGQYGQILSGLKGGVSSADFMGGGDPSSSAIGKNYDLAYTYLDEESLADPYFKNRFTSYGAKPGIYRIIRQSNPVFRTRAKGDTSTTKTVTRYYRVMTERSIPTYSSKFKFFDLSRQTIEQEFAKRFRDNILR